MIDINALRQVPLFADLSKEQLCWVAEHGSEIWLEPGELLLAQGAPADYFYIMLEGEARFMVKIGDQEALFGTHQTGEFFAEGPLILGTPYLGTGHALRKSHLFRLAADSFWEMLITFPSMTRTILCSTAQRAQIWQTLILHAGETGSSWQTISWPRSRAEQSGSSSFKGSEPVARDSGSPN